MNFYGEMPASYNITVNMQNPLIAKIFESKPAAVKDSGKAPDEEAAKEEKESRKAELQLFAKGSEMLRQVVDLALLSNGMLKGKALSDFIARSSKVVEDAWLK